MNGTIFDIQRFCVHDGPGIRTTVFFKGCPLHCIWCHNPESQKREPEIAYYPQKCIGCGGCTAVCPEGCHALTEAHCFDRSRCTVCGKCVDACAADALELLGRNETAEAVLQEVLRDRSFYQNSGGGLTLSGGEPLLQSAFLLELLKGAKAEGLHTCIETCGFAPKEVLREAARYTDLFLFDVKETDDERHQRLIGVPFAPILENLRYLSSLGADIILRCPLIPEVNDREEHLTEIARLAAELTVREINVMAYHRLGDGKYDAIGTENPFPDHQAMTTAQKQACIDTLTEKLKAITDKEIKVC